MQYIMHSIPCYSIPIAACAQAAFIFSVVPPAPYSLLSTLRYFLIAACAWHYKASASRHSPLSPLQLLALKTRYACLYLAEHVK